MEAEILKEVQFLGKKQRGRAFLLLMLIGQDRLMDHQKRARRMSLNGYHPRRTRSNRNSMMSLLDESGALGPGS